MPLSLPSTPMPRAAKSNLFTQFSEAKARGESVREHEKGVPFLYYNWNKYVNRNNPDDVITKEAYAELSDRDKQQYKGVKNREIRVLFNIDQTLLPMANETAYTTALKKDGTMEDRGYGDKEDKQLHGARQRIPSEDEGQPRECPSGRHRCGAL